mmetsp:Transcript_3670/g.12060  ORF Transcript_3670/g.12060 Transcript_3670/m.12060 type:complete len:558 (-) Transcript_3670:43-1716(-)
MAPARRGVGGRRLARSPGFGRRPPPQEGARVPDAAGDSGEDVAPPDARGPEARDRSVCSALRVAAASVSDGPERLLVQVLRGAQELASPTGRAAAGGIRREVAGVFHRQVRTDVLRVRRRRRLVVAARLGLSNRRSRARVFFFFFRKWWCQKRRSHREAAVGDTESCAANPGRRRRRREGYAPRLVDSGGEGPGLEPRSGVRVSACGRRRRGRFFMRARDPDGAVADGRVRRPNAHSTRHGHPRARPAGRPALADHRHRADAVPRPPARTEPKFGNRAARGAARSLDAEVRRSARRAEGPRQVRRRRPAERRQGSHPLAPRGLSDRVPPVAPQPRGDAPRLERNLRLSAPAEGRRPGALRHPQGPRTGRRRRVGPAIPPRPRGPLLASLSTKESPPDRRPRGLARREEGLQMPHRRARLRRDPRRHRRAARGQGPGPHPRPRHGRLGPQRPEHRPPLPRLPRRRLRRPRRTRRLRPPPSRMHPRPRQAHRTGQGQSDPRPEECHHSKASTTTPGGCKGAEVFSAERHHQGPRRGSSGDDFKKRGGGHQSRTYLNRII